MEIGKKCWRSWGLAMRGKLKQRIEIIDGIKVSLCASDFIRKARKERICEKCGRKIKKGEKYLYCVMGNLPPISYCLDCVKELFRAD